MKAQIVTELVAVRMRGEAQPTAMDVARDADGDGTVPLSEIVCRIKSVPEWETLARMQPCVTVAALQSAGKGDFFALEDRNLMTAPWRRIFAIFDGHSFVVFDQVGQLIVEPIDGLVNGRQLKEDLVGEFSEEEDGFYYRSPRLRRSPLDRRRSVSLIEQCVSESSSSVRDRLDAAARVPSTVTVQQRAATVRMERPASDGASQRITTPANAKRVRSSKVRTQSLEHQLLLPHARACTRLCLYYSSLCSHAHRAS